MNQLFKTLLIAAFIATIGGQPVSLKNEEDIINSAIANIFGPRNSTMNPAWRGGQLCTEFTKQLFKTLLIAAFVAAMGGQPVSLKNEQNINSAIANIFGPRDSAVNPAFGLKPDNDNISVFGPKNFSVTPKAEAVEPKPNNSNIDLAISSVYGPKVSSVSPKAETDEPKPNNEDIDLAISSIFRRKYSSVTPKAEAVETTPNNKKMNLAISNIFRPKVSKAEAVVAKNNNVDMESLLSEVFGPKGSSALVTETTNKTTSQPSFQLAQNASSANGDQKNHSEVSEAPQYCLRDDGELGVCVPYYLCNTPDGSDEYDSDEDEKGIDIKGTVPKYCPFYLETCCTQKDKVEKSEALKPNFDH